MLGDAPRAAGITLMVDGNQVSWDQDGTGGISAAVKIGNRQRAGHRPLRCCRARRCGGWSEVATGDFNHDGRTDVLWQHDSDGATAAWLMGADGAPTTTPSYLRPTGWSLAAHGDFGGNAATDLLWTNAGTGQSAIWLMADGNVASHTFSLATNGWTEVGQGDFNSMTARPTSCGARMPPATPPAG